MYKRYIEFHRKPTSSFSERLAAEPLPAHDVVMKLFFILILLLLNPTLYAYAEQPKIELKDLGFTSAETQASPALQKTLEDRRFYLHQHQIWGIVSTVAMAAAVFSGGEDELPPEHPFFAGLAAASYTAAAYMAYMAPQLPEGKKYGGSVWHRRLVWIHLPGMILTPVLGYMAAKKVDRGEKVDGLAKYHQTVAGVTAAALLASVLTVSIEF